VGVKVDLLVPFLKRSFQKYRIFIRSNTGIIMNGEFWRICKEAVVTYF